METIQGLLSDKVAWAGRKLAITDESLIDTVLRRQALSASTSASMQDCAARWVGERLLRGTEENPFDPAPLGTSAHAVLEDLMALPAPRRTMATAKEILMAKAETQWPDPPHGSSDHDVAEHRIAKVSWIAEVESAYQGLWAMMDPTQVNVFAREMQIDGVDIDGVPVNGFVDLTRFGRVRGKPGLIVEDYKTSRKLPNKRFGDEHGDQIRIYKVAIEKKTGMDVVGGRDLYTRLGKASVVDLSPAAVSKTVDSFKLSWKRHNRYMDTGEFPTKVSALCGWCPLVASCPAAADQGKEARKEDLPTAVDLGIPTLRPGTDPAPGGGAPVPAVASAGYATAQTTAVHIPVAGAPVPALTMKDSNMSNQIEDKAWVPLLPNGELNPNSYASTAAFGLSSLAVKMIHKAGRPLSATEVLALAETFLHITTQAQMNWNGSSSLADGANTRLRGALNTALDTLPIPFDAGDQEWDEWVSIIIRRVQSITTVALSLAYNGADAKPWRRMSSTKAAALAVVPEPAVKDDADDEFEQPTPASSAVRRAPKPATVEDDDFVFPDDEKFAA